MVERKREVPSLPLGEQPDASFRDPALEYPDPTPVVLPVGCEHPEPIGDMIRRLIRNEMSREAAEAGDETFEEANDFEVDEDPDTGLFSPYERLPLQEERPIAEEFDAQSGGTEATQSGAGSDAGNLGVKGDVGAPSQGSAGDGGSAAPGGKPSAPGAKGAGS